MVRRIPFGLLLVPLLLAGCYTYTPVRMDGVAPGSTVRAHVDEPLARELTALTGQLSPVRVVEGDVLWSRPDSLILAVTVAVRDLGSRQEPLRQQIHLPADQLLSVETREIDRTRTGILAGAVSVVIIALMIRIFAGESGSTPDSPPPGPVDVRIPLFRP